MVIRFFSRQRRRWLRPTAPEIFTIMALWFIFLLVCISFAGCQKELYYGHKVPEELPEGNNNLRVRLDWTAVASDARPEVMRLDLFPTKDTHAFEMLNYEFGLVPYLDVRVPADTWQILAYNIDTDILEVHGRTYDETMVTTRGTTLQEAASMFTRTQRVPVALTTENQPIVVEPDMLWTGSNAGVNIESLDDKKSALIPMQTSVQTIHVIIHHVSNIKYISAQSGTISGMADAMYPASGQPSDAQCIVPFEMVSEGDSTLVGTVHTFGHCSARECEHKMCVYAILHDDSKWWYTFDVTEQLHSWPYREPEIVIEVDGLPFPEPIDPTSGIVPVVDEWQEVKIEVPMN